MFGSTYVCDSTFLSLARRKNKFRNSLFQHLESEIPCEISKSKLNLNNLIELEENRPSHGHPSQCIKTRHYIKKYKKVYYNVTVINVYYIFFILKSGPDKNMIEGPNYHTLVYTHDI